jgi:sulfur carrier protein ThiS adenylyltransferase
MDDPIFERNVPGTTEKLRRRCVGIAGCGGLGSNAAMALVRCGVGRLILVDGDVVEASNLNRQHYFRADIGRRKVEALSDHLRAVNPAVLIEAHAAAIGPGDVAKVFGGADLLVEAFDRAESKKWLIETWGRLFPGRPIVCGNGLAGCGGTSDLKVTRAGSITFCGDGVTDMSAGLCGARVAIVAAMEANIAVELLVAMEDGKP